MKMPKRAKAKAKTTTRSVQGKSTTYRRAARNKTAVKAKAKSTAHG